MNINSKLLTSQLFTVKHLKLLCAKQNETIKKIFDKIHVKFS